MYIGKTSSYFENIKIRNEISLVSMENSIAATNYLNENKSPDAIICEYNLAGNNGLFFFDWIKKQEKFHGVPFILLTKEFSIDVYKLSFTQSVDDYYATSVTKPEDIINRIEFFNKYIKNNIKINTPRDKEEIFKMPLSKRIFDIFVASFVLLVASPFLLLILLAIKLESKGKVYYISKRVGRKTFDFYKLRSMRTGSDELLKKLAAEKNQYNTQPKANENIFDMPCPRCSKLTIGETCSPLMYIENHQICDYWYNHQKNEAANNSATFVKIVNGPRVTRVGKFIRNTSIDELPQLINVLKGDMSIVGNRPLPVYEAELLTADALSNRFLAPAGITGLWQVELRGKGGNMSEEERIRLDNEYAEHFKGDNYSFWYDMKLILRTIPALLQKDSV